MIPSVNIQNNSSPTINIYNTGDDEQARYHASRKWSDSYTEAMNDATYTLLAENRLITPIFTMPTFTQDAAHGIDMLMDFSSLKISYRIRACKYRSYFNKGFGLRDTEVEKILAGKYQADYLIYSLGEKEEGRLESAKLINMRKVGNYLREDESLIEQAFNSGNLLAFEYNAFPSSVVAGEISYSS